MSGDSMTGIRPICAQERKHIMNELIMAKYGEIALKGLNKGTFEDILVKNIRRRLRHCGKFHYMRKQSTIYIEPVAFGRPSDDGKEARLNTDGHP